MSAEEEALVATAEQLRKEEALVEGARQIFKSRLHCLGFLAAKFRLWQNRDGQTAGSGAEKNRWNRMGHEAKTCTNEYTSLQKEFQATIARSNGWRVLMKGRRLGLAGALHYLACAYTTSSAVKQLAKLRCSEDSEAYSRK